MIPGRLDFRLPDFTRIVWASERHREVWGARLQRIGNAWGEMERWSVVDGVRPSALQMVAPEGLPGVAAWAARHGIVAVPLARIVSSPDYSSTATPAGPSDPWVYRVAICRPEIAHDWPGADDAKVGELLGFPSCCREFFDRVWVKGGLVDTTWPMFESTGSAQGPPEANILLRWLNVRLVPHLPCSTSCEASAELGRAMAELGLRHGFAEEVAWIREMLDWPVEWSALHGIAEILYPVAKVSTMTEATAGKLVVRREGVAPPDAARGTVFPFARTELVQLKVGRRRKALRSLDPREWEDNGFASLDAMEEAHAVVLEAAGRLTDGDHLTDLGCGNGRLLESFRKRVSGLVVSGVEVLAERAERARARLPGADIKIGEMCGCGSWPKASHVLLMPGRLLEHDSHRLRSWLVGRVLVVYAYGDWLSRHGGLSGLCEAAGLVLTTPVAESPGAAVGLATLVELAPATSATPQLLEVP